MPEDNTKPKFPYKKFMREAMALDPENPNKHCAEKAALLLKYDPHHFAYLSRYDLSSAAGKRAVGGAFKGTYHTGTAHLKEQLQARLEKESAIQEPIPDDLAAKIKEAEKIYQRATIENERVGLRVNQAILFSLLAYLAEGTPQKKKNR